jgi:valyl-tRNA synthetase
VVEVPGDGDGAIIRDNVEHIRNLAKVEAVSVDARVAKPEASATAVFGENQVHVLLKGLLDFEEERKRLRKEIGKIEKELEASNRKLSNSQFVEKAPQDIVAGVREKVGALGLKLEKLNQNLNFFESIHE